MKKIIIIVIIHLVFLFELASVPASRGETGDIIGTIKTEEAQLNALAFDGQGDLWFNRPVSLQSYLFEVDERGKTKAGFSSTYTEYTGMVWISPYLYALSTSSPNRIHVIDLEHQEIVGDIRIPEESCSLLAFDGNSFWTFSKKQEKIIELNWQGEQIGFIDPVHEGITGLAFKDNAFWQLTTDSEISTLFQTDPETGKVVNSFDVNKALANLTFYGNELWVVEQFLGNAYQIEADTFISQNITHHWNLKGSLVAKLRVGQDTHWLPLHFREEFLLKSDKSFRGIVLKGQWDNSLQAVNLSPEPEDIMTNFLFPVLLSLGYAELKSDEMNFDMQKTQIRCIPFLKSFVLGMPHIQGQGHLEGTYQNLEYSFQVMGILWGEALPID